MNKYNFKLSYISMLIGVFALIILTCGACEDDVALPKTEDPTIYPESGYITIELKCSDISTRANKPEPGVTDLNENKINTVTLCLSPAAGDRTDNDLPAYSQTFTNLEAQNTVTVRIPLTMDLQTRLFNENSTSSCYVFAAVNVDTRNAKTVADMRKLTIGPNFVNSQKEASFAMDGVGEITYNEITNAATGTIQVQRSAAKITLALNVDTEVSEIVGDKVIKWTSDRSRMRVRLQQGVHTSTLDPIMTPVNDVYFNTQDKFNYNFKNDPSVEQGTMKYKYDWIQEIPFYTYPHEWSREGDEIHSTYMILSVPWKKDGENTYRTCYYHVPIVPTNMDQEIVRNISYHINLHVGALGSFVPEEPLEVEADYYTANWGEEDIDVDIKDYRYLVVDYNEYVVNNETNITIPFYTSHPTKVVSTKMTFYRYNFSDQGSEFAVTVNDKENDLTFTNSGETYKVFDADFNNSRKELNVSHDLVVWKPYNASGREVLLTRNVNGDREDIDVPSAINAMLASIAYYVKSDDAEYSAVKFEVTVQHIDVNDGSSGLPKDSYQETITIWQYPGIYITAKQNYCANLQDKIEANAIFGNTLINNNTNGNTIKFTQGSDFVLDTDNTARVRRIYNYRNWDRSIGLGFPPTYFNWNPNLYLVTITQLSQELGEKYVIDDPRSYNINNDLSNNYGSYTVDGGTESVFSDEYYYFSGKGSNYQMRMSKTPLNPWPTFTYNNQTVNTALQYTINGYVKAKALDGTERQLKYYYPTREAENNKYTIAPKFRICSSYAGTSGYLTREMARRRAAAYQELGYPAGRWRLPTFGEVEYIMTLAAEQKIPRLFGTKDAGTWYYWCAQGAVSVPDGASSNQTITINANPTSGGLPVYTMPLAPFSGDNYLARTRFVYDEWYWGNDTLQPKKGITPNGTTLMYDFTWGDRRKSNPEQQN